MSCASPFAPGWPAARGDTSERPASRCGDQPRPDSFKLSNHSQACRSVILFFLWLGEQPLADVVRRGEQSGILDSFAILCAHGTADVPHDRIDRYLIAAAAANRFQVVPQNVERQSFPFDP